MQLFAIPQNAERIAAKAVADGLHDGHGGSGCNRRVYRVAALEQHAQAGLRAQRMRGGHNIARKQRQAGGGVGVVEVEIETHGNLSKNYRESAITLQKSSALK